MAPGPDAADAAFNLSRALDGGDATAIESAMRAYKAHGEYWRRANICHIFPFSLGKNHVQKNSFSDSLSLLWSQDKIEAWKKDHAGHGGTEMCSNMLALNSNAHQYW
ncbi:hypothetical protein P175DRAFT_0489183 [Aspergillus ochraceoroseus IBT 24754]|uniref:HNH nuclease domain-containing protein n=1 Tax=Aspergillus ochraceoroseus IBT 24754 TaxID=1392256 RepID=A0A2T5M690_9EURO|nr:uncharacterized protein P175DRAFT_0489183 [Aspergillus ochraceoroseus IBT 24754]PTU24016.1 hypothetical protein P175DRAFT_0489183 [Aspergillus ochraceoroseus IBT 24754]